MIKTNQPGSTRGTSTQMGTGSGKASMRTTKGTIYHGKTTKPRRVLPREVRENPFCNLPILMDEDLNDGIMSLISQGLIPKDVDVTPALDRDDPVLKATRLGSQD